MLSLKNEHSFFHGSIKTKRYDIGGVSLGLFIFVSGNENEQNSAKTAVHEYGHTIQSLILGPLYLPVIGVVSATWCALPYFKKLRRERNISYSACFTESWANRLGEKILKMPSIDY